ncbi:PhzF family phenazine biosynthesis protein [Cricetibacter osteomyelitidis]|uniref:PhzF family phenazine biosynthesis protein n=2 Tax=Cricetibacter osteomyelitidis TaxID=1521931 RepID=A0A4V2T1W8_9PAST|nr:PhzF family phenazine biosynthesis protein [Cricetibacter osteomyelitidis]
MKSYNYQLVNVFAESHFGGNPLAVFTDADNLTDEQMQLIARQFNLSECVFFQTATDKSAVRKLRIFTPGCELPFAGHPTIGSAFVLHTLLNLGDDYMLETQSGLVEIHHQNDVITLALKNGVKTAECTFSTAQCAELLGLQESDILNADWVNTGTNQLLIRVNSESAVENCKISAALFNQILPNRSVYVWFTANNQAKVRLFFQANGIIAEDPGTGSAAANLGGWCIVNGLSPIDWTINQGDEIDRPNRLSLKVDENKTIFVGGKVIKVGQGELLVP